MASEIQYVDVPDMTVYALLFRRSDGKVWNGSAFEVLAAANWATYAIAMADAEDVGCYLADMPAVAAGDYRLAFYEQAGGTPDFTDDYLWPEMLCWDGSAVVDVGALSTQVSAMTPGTGERTVVVTVTDGSSNPLPGARVRYVLGSSTRQQTAGSTGQVTFNLEDGTWTEAVTLAGYQYDGAARVVDGDKSFSAVVELAPTSTSGSGSWGWP